jgi:hypothetical protein
MMYLFLTNHRQDVLTSTRKITARKRSPGLLDCRDVGQVFEYKGPLPHPAQDQPQ